MKHVVIIGNGISGITAARNIRKKSDFKITVISNETSYFFSRTALMYVYMGHMKFENTQPYENGFWKKNRIDLLHDEVLSVNTDNKSVVLKKIKSLQYDILIIATGSLPNKFGWKGQDLKGVQGMYHKQDLESLEALSDSIERGVVVGGGLIGIELAEMLLSRGKKVTFLVRESSFWKNILPIQQSERINKLIQDHHIDLRLNSELEEIKNDGSGRVKSIITKAGEEIECQFVGLTIGVTPNILFLKGSKIATDRGVLVNKQLETNIPDVYAIGDCVQHMEAPAGRRPVEQVWYTGRIMGETVAKTICGEPTEYQPGNWFNSAKFLNLEYQTYGWVWASPKENEDFIYWQDTTEERNLYFTFDKQSRQFLGVNTFGIRLRHEVMDRWLSNSETVDYVIKNIKEALFDPEFFKRVDLNE